MVELIARPEPVDIEPANTALVVVDMQNAFASKGGMLDLFGLDISGAAEAVQASKRVLEACRAAGVRVVYLQMTYSEDLADAGDRESPNYHKELGMVLMRRQQELHGKILVRGTWDWQIVEDLAPQPGDIVVEKTRYSGFCRTGLADMLRKEGIRNLLFTGIATNICVESTARDGYFEEFWPILVEDAVNHAGPDFTRQATVWTFENVFGWVTSSGDVLSAFAKQ